MWCGARGAGVPERGIVKPNATTPKPYATTPKPHTQSSYYSLWLPALMRAFLAGGGTAWGGGGGQRV